MHTTKYFGSFVIIELARAKRELAPTFHSWYNGIDAKITRCYVTRGFVFKIKYYI
jgi:hypothetical protein